MSVRVYLSVGGISVTNRLSQVQVLGHALGDERLGFQGDGVEAELEFHGLGL